MGSVQKHIIRLVGAIFLVVFLPRASAQVEYESPPHLHGFLKGSEFIADVDSSLLSFMKTTVKTRNNGPMQFAIPVDVSLSPGNSGVIFRKNGMNVWSLTIISPGAESVNLVFGQYRMPPGGKLVVYTPDKLHVRGAFTCANNSPSGVLPVMPLPGDVVIVELQLPDGVSFDETVGISRIGHDFTGIIGDKGNKDGRYGLSQPCNVDVACIDDEQVNLVKRSVLRIIVDGIQLCSGVMLNTTDPNAPPILMTAEHCISNNYEASRSLLLFNYESPWCDGPDGYSNQSVAGATFLLADANLDYAVVQLNDHPPISYKPYYSGWDVTGEVPASTYTMHHPSGDVKKISSDYDAPETGSYLTFEKNAFWKVLRWDQGATEGGSSGAPLFSPGGMVIGVLSGGVSVCGNPVNDYFLKLHSAYTANPYSQVNFRSLIDPKGFGFRKLIGIDPYISNSTGADTLSNIPPQTPRSVTALTSPGLGFTTGFNTDTINGYGEFLGSTGRKYILELLIRPSVARSQSPTDSITFSIRGVSGGKPGSIIAQVKAAMIPSYSNHQISIPFRNAAEVNGDFFVTWELSYLMPVFPDLRQFAVYHSPEAAEPSENTAWFRINGSWDPFLIHPSMPGAYSLDVAVVTAESTVRTDVKGVAEAAGFVIYPNPAGSFINIRSDQISGDSFIYIVDSAGRVCHTDSVTLNPSGDNNLKTDKLAPGLYIVVVENNGRRFTARFIKGG